MRHTSDKQRPRPRPIVKQASANLRSDAHVHRHDLIFNLLTTRKRRVNRCLHSRWSPTDPVGRLTWYSLAC